MWKIIIIAREQFDSICDAFTKYDVKYRRMKDFMEIKDPLIYITIFRNPTFVRGYRADIIYCDREGQEDEYDYIITPCANGGIIKPLHKLLMMLNINEKV